MLKRPPTKPLNLNIVTVMTDASFCPDTGASGWGIYIRYKGQKFEKGGNFKENPSGPMEAELMAMVIGASYAITMGWFETKTKLLIQTDCKDAMRAVHGAGDTSVIKRAREILFGYQRTHGVELQLRYVKAHAPGIAARNWCNDRCDFLAKKFMREQRHIIKIQRGEIKVDQSIPY